jgi:hypothetical protein
MTDDKNHVRQQLKPTNKIATGFTKIVSVCMGATAVLGVVAAGFGAANDMKGEAAIAALTSMVATAGAVALWQTEAGADRANKFCDLVEKQAAASQAQAAMKS